MSKAEDNTDAPSAEPAVHADSAPPSVGSGSPTITGPANAAADSDPKPAPAAETADVADAAYAAFEAPELSSDEAERFASRFRASWEPSSPTAPALAERARSVHPAVVTLPDEDFDIGTAGAFPGAAQRKRGLLIASGAIVGFFALVSLAFVMGTRGAASPRAAVEQASKAAAAAATPAPVVAEPAAPVVAEPAPAPDPEPEQPAAELAAAEPGEPSEPGEPAEPNAAVEAVAPGDVAPGDTAATPTAAAPAAEPLPAADEAEKPAPEKLAADKPAADEPAPAARLVAGAELAENREPATVHVDIAASPADAQLSIDGERVTNPFETRAPKGGRHRVLAEAPGHRSRDLTLEFNRDQHLDIRLERLSAAKKPASAHARTASSTPAHRTQPAAPSAQPKGAGFVSESPY